jgi:MFS transporter, CP family, cyanate transporter
VTASRPDRSREPGLGPATHPGPEAGAPPGSVGRAAPDAAVRVLVTVAIVLVAFNLRPAVTSAGALLPELRELTAMSGTLSGILTSLPPICFGVFGLLGARAGRRFGIAPTVVAAMLLTSLALVARVVGDSAVVLLLWTGAALAGMAVGNVLLPVAVKRWFPDRVGAATGWYSVSLAAGTAVGAGIAVPLEGALGSVRLSLAFWALPPLAATIPWAWVWVRDRAVATGRLAAPTAEPEPTGAATAKELRHTVRRHRKSWALMAFFGLQSSAAYIVMGWLPSIYRDAGVPADTAGALLAGLMMVGVPVSLALPVLAGRSEDQRPLVVGLVTAGAAGYTGLLVAPAAAPWVWAVLIGIGLGAFPMALVLIGLRARSPSGTAELSSFAQGGGYLLAAVGPFAIGVLRDATGSWSPPLAVLLALLVPQLVAGLLAATPGAVDDVSGDRPVGHRAR